MANKKWKDFEILVAKVQSDLAPDAVVKINQKIIGKISKTPRQVDVLVQKKMGEHFITIAIECKDYNKPLNIKHVESIIGQMQDIEVNIGIIVSAKGFTKAALEVGRHAGLKLYKLIDTGNHDWKAEVGISSVCFVKNLTQFNFVIGYLASRPIPLDHSFMLYDKNQQKIGLAQDVLVDWWLNEHNGMSVGYHEKVEFIKGELFFLIDDLLMPIDITANLQVDELVYFRQWPLTEISGFQDQISKGIETRGFTLSNLNLDELKNNWIKITNKEKLSIKPIITMSITTYARL